MKQPITKTDAKTLRTILSAIGASSSVSFPAMTRLFQKYGIDEEKMRASVKEFGPDMTYAIISRNGGILDHD